MTDDETYRRLIDPHLSQTEDLHITFEGDYTSIEIKSEPT